MKKILKRLGSLLVRLLIVLVMYAGLVGLMFWFMFTDFENGYDRGFAYYMLSFLIPYFLLTIPSIVVHELGHVVGGLLSGYRFSCLRAGSIAFINDGGKLRLKRFSLPGTGGQCIMFPPELKDGKMPVIAYYLGGSAMNLIVALVCTALFFLLRTHRVPALWLGLFALLNLYYALRNGVPIRSKWLVNDGLNALLLTRHPEIIPFYWTSMKMHELSAQGVRQKDMPEEWFSLPEMDAIPHDVRLSRQMFAIIRLLDGLRFEEAAQSIRAALEHSAKSMSMSQGQLTCNLLLCELLGENRADVIESLMTPAQKKFIKVMRKMPTVILLQYAMALLIDGAPEKAAQLRRQYDKLAARYPYPTELESDYETMALIDARYAEHAAQDEPLRD